MKQGITRTSFLNSIVFRWLGFAFVKYFRKGRDLGKKKNLEKKPMKKIARGVVFFLTHEISVEQYSRI